LPSPRRSPLLYLIPFCFVVGDQASRCCLSPRLVQFACAHACPLSALATASGLAWVSMGVRCLVSRCCHSTGGLRRAHSRAAVTGTRRLSYTSTGTNSLANKLLLGLAFLPFLGGGRHGAHTIERLPSLLRHPQPMQQDSEFTSHGHNGTLLGILTSPFTQLLPPAFDRTVGGIDA
jgi:hypothetical protein